MLQIALLLGLFSVVGISIVAVTEHFTREKIIANEQAALRRSIEAVLPASRYDNSILKDTIQVTDPALLGTNHPVLVYRARQDGQPVAAILTPIAPDGYNGAIKLLVGICYNGKLTGVRVISHHETPGLGDKIEEEKSDWILDFSGHSLSHPAESKWKVMRDGGIFDQFTGATVTPRAIVKAVRNCLKYFEDHRDALFAQDEKTLNATSH